MLLSTLGVIMEQVQYSYSMKNIPIPSKQDYMTQMIYSVEKFTKNIRWRSFHYLNPSPSSKKETFGFQTTKPPPQVPELKHFENRLYELIKSIKFRLYSNNFQDKLKNDIKDMENEEKMIIAADKTNNFYKLEAEEYDQLLQKNVMKDYKKIDEKAFDDNTKKERDIAAKLELDDRIYQTSKKQAFISLKDHKPNFHNKPTCRLINPMKTELGKISKQIISEIVKNVKEKQVRLNQWISTDEVIEWFNKISNKNRFTFLQFDIVDFYPSISQELLKNAINFARKHVNISDDDLGIILQARKSFLNDKNTLWTKTENSDFDVAMGSFDGAECCELVGLYILSKLQPMNINVGLYRDDALGVLDCRPRQAELKKKEICRIFKELNLSITIEVNVKVVNFLDITLDLSKGIYKPYMKPGNTPLYINKGSNHPPLITKNIPAAINRRLNNISINEEVFKDAIPPYQEALDKGGYEFKLKFEPPHQKQQQEEN